MVFTPRNVVYVCCLNGLWYYFVLLLYIQKRVVKNLLVDRLYSGEFTHTYQPYKRKKAVAGIGTSREYMHPHQETSTYRRRSVSELRGPHRQYARVVGAIGGTPSPRQSCQLQIPLHLFAQLEHLLLATHIFQRGSEAQRQAEAGAFSHATEAGWRVTDHRVTHKQAQAMCGNHGGARFH